MAGTASDYSVWSFMKRDWSTAMLVGANLATIAAAVAFQWGLVVVLLGYWVQSVIIGFFNFLRIITLEKYSAKGMRGNRAWDGTYPMSAEFTKFFTAFFFLFHYGFFHFVYLVFLVGFSGLLLGGAFGAALSGVGLIGVIFFINHAFSFWYGKKRTAKKRLNLGSLMFYPYIRIVPMHLTIMAAGALFVFGQGMETVLLVGFLLLKTAADVVMHGVEHKVLYGEEVPART